jgi:hypothetical protein
MRQMWSSRYLCTLREASGSRVVPCLAVCRLTLRCTRLATAGFARFRERVNLNVRTHMPWPRANYFNSGTAEARQRMAELQLVDRANWYELYRRETATVERLMARTGG